MKIKILLATSIVAALNVAPAWAVSTGSVGSEFVSEDYVVGPTTPGKWGDPTIGTGATITWSIMPDSTDCSAESVGLVCSALDTFMPTDWKAEIENAFSAWSAVADLTFVEVPDGGEAFNSAGSSGDIRLGGHTFDGEGGTLAHGYYPPVNGDTAAGDLHFDTDETWKIGFGGTGFDIFQVAAHEIGHAIGLDHTGVTNSLMNPFYTEAFRGLQADDIAGAVYLYGPSPVPVPAGVWLFASAFGLLIPRLRKKG